MLSLYARYAIAEPSLPLRYSLASGYPPACLMGTCQYVRHQSWRVGRRIITSPAWSPGINRCHIDVAEVTRGDVVRCRTELTELRVPMSDCILNIGHCEVSRGTGDVTSHEMSHVPMSRCHQSGTILVSRDVARFIAFLSTFPCSAS